MSAQPDYPTPLRAERGGLAPPTSLPMTKPARDLHIDHRILAQPGLSLLACAVLAEILDLHQVKGQVFASDEHFAERCRCSPRKSRETIAELELAGYLARDVNHARRHKRLLIPTDKWQNLPGVAAESAGSSGRFCRELRQNLPGVVAESANINTSLNTKTNTNLNQAAGAAGGGEESFETLAADCPDDAAHTEGGGTDVATSTPKPVGPRGWAYDPAALADNLRLPFASEAFRAAWVGYRTYREEMKYRRLSGGMMEQQQLDNLAQLATGDEAHALALIAHAIGKGWQDFYPLDKPYATARPASQRPAAGPGRVETLAPTSYGRNRGASSQPTSPTP